MAMFSGLFGGGGGAKRAADVEAAAIDKAKAEFLAASEVEQQKFQPYLQAGQEAIAPYQEAVGQAGQQTQALDPRLQELYGERQGMQPQVGEMYGLAQQQDPIMQEILSGGQGFETSPGYQFRLEQGQQALDRSQSAKGGLLSGAAAKESMRYGQGMASKEYQNYMSGLYNQLGAVGTQMGGREQALGAGYQQLGVGQDLLGQGRSNIGTQLQQAGGYLPLISGGLSATGTSAGLGYTGAQNVADMTTQKGQVLAGGMRDKDAQLQASGEQWQQIAATAATGLMGGGGGMGGGGYLGMGGSGGFGGSYGGSGQGSSYGHQASAPSGSRYNYI